VLKNICKKEYPMTDSAITRCRAKANAAIRMIDLDQHWEDDPGERHWHWTHCAECGRKSKHTLCAKCARKICP
jgi:hypothetical protein